MRVDTLVYLDHEGNVLKEYDSEGLYVPHAGDVFRIWRQKKRGWSLEPSKHGTKLLRVLAVYLEPAKRRILVLTHPFASRPGEDIPSFLEKD